MSIAGLCDEPLSLKSLRNDPGPDNPIAATVSRATISLGLDSGEFQVARSLIVQFSVLLEQRLGFGDREKFRAPPQRINDRVLDSFVGL